MKIKFRAWDGEAMYPHESIGEDYDFEVGPNGLILMLNEQFHETGSGVAEEYWQYIEKKGAIFMQFTGLTDENGKDYCISDIGEFDNGDRFVLKMEDWLEIYVDWIGDPECEDQARDLYRISRAKIIGNTHENPELICAKK